MALTAQLRAISAPWPDWGGAPAFRRKDGGSGHTGTDGRKKTTAFQAVGAVWKGRKGNLRNPRTQSENAKHRGSYPVFPSIPSISFQEY